MNAIERVARDAASRDGLGRARGHAELDFAVDAHSRTFLARHYATYPYHVTQAFHLDVAAPAAATVYLQSLSGGLVQGDHVACRVRTFGRAIAHVTTQSATKVHSMEKGEAAHAVELKARDRSHLEYLGDPTIFFPHSRLASSVVIRTGVSASAIFGESFLWHDPRGGDLPACGSLRSELAVYRPAGRLLVLDRLRFGASDAMSGVPGLLGRYRAFGTLLAIGGTVDARALLEELRDGLNAIPGIYAGASTLPGAAGVWLRVLAEDGAALKRALLLGWQGSHEAILGWPCEPRRK